MTESLNEQIREAIGEVAHQALLEQLGGSQLYIPAKIGKHHPIAVAAGREAADILAVRFTGTTVTLPVTAKKRRLIEDAIRANTPVNQIAARYFCSVRYVWKVKADMVEGTAPKQMGLF